jgi:TnsA endonuclease N terminal
MRKPWLAVFDCEQCNARIERMTTQKSAPRFCSKSCSNKWQHAKGIRRAYCADKTIEEWWRCKYSEEEIEVLRQKMSEKVLLDRNRPRSERYSEEALAKMSAYAKLAWDQKYGIEKSEKLKKERSENCGWRGKSIEERHGPEKSKSIRVKAATASRGKKRTQQTREKMSLARHRVMKEEPSKCSTWGIKGWYKGFFFRSSYEYFFMKKLESDGLDLPSSLVQETFRIPYYSQGKDSYYIPDFYVPSRSCVYEIKNEYSLLTDLRVSAKHEQARKFFEDQGINFTVVTETDLPIPANRRRLRSTIEKDPDVKLLDSSINSKMDT